MEEINELVTKEFNGLNILEQIKNISENYDEKNDLQIIYKNLSIIYYEPESKKKNDYKVFYYKYYNEDSYFFKKTYITAQLKIMNSFDRLSINLFNLMNISEFGYTLLKTIINSLEEELKNNCEKSNNLIKINQKFLICRKNLRNVKYNLHKHFNSFRYPSISVNKLDLIIIINNEIKKNIYRINFDSILEKNSINKDDQKQIEKFNKDIFEWLNTEANLSYAKFLPVKTTIGEKLLSATIPESFLKHYKINEDKLPSEYKDIYCLVYNTHFKVKMIYKFDLNNNNKNLNKYAYEENNIDDDIIFNKHISEEDIVKRINLLKEHPFNLDIKKKEITINDNVIDDVNIFN